MRCMGIFCIRIFLYRLSDYEIILYINLVGKLLFNSHSYFFAYDKILPAKCGSFEAFYSNYALISGLQPLLIDFKHLQF
jgi:hypothetical protein